MESVYRVNLERSGPDLGLLGGDDEGGGVRRGGRAPASRSSTTGRLPEGNRVQGESEDHQHAREDEPGRIDMGLCGGIEYESEEADEGAIDRDRTAWPVAKVAGRGRSDRVWNVDFGDSGYPAIEPPDLLGFGVDDDARDTAGCMDETPDVMTTIDMGAMLNVITRFAKLLQWLPIKPNLSTLDVVIRFSTQTLLNSYDG